MCSAVNGLHVLNVLGFTHCYKVGRRVRLPGRVYPQLASYHCRWLLFRLRRLWISATWSRALVLVSTCVCDDRIHFTISNDRYLELHLLRFSLSFSIPLCQIVVLSPR